MEVEQGQVAVRAAVQALDAALAEHRRALALAASRRERERMAGGRAVKAVAAASERAAAQPVERPIRLLRLAETWLEIDRVRHPLDGSVRGTVAAGELRVTGDGWAARIALAPGEGPAAAAREAAARIAAAAPAAPARARDRLALVLAAGARHAEACLGAATVLAACDRELAERHADHARVQGAMAQLAARLGPWRLGEPPDIASARDRLAQAHAHLAGAPEQPYAWVAEEPPAVAGPLLRDVPADRLDAARPAAVRLIASLRDGEPLVALAAADRVVAGLTAGRVVIAGPHAAVPYPAADVEAHGDRLVAGGQEIAGSLAERQPGRLAAALELVRAAHPAGPPPAPVPEPAGDDPLELLRRLGELRDAGVIERAEFEAKKADLLRRI
jgi:hypothetical protein